MERGRVGGSEDLVLVMLRREAIVKSCVFCGAGVFGFDFLYLQANIIHTLLSFAGQTRRTCDSCVPLRHGWDLSVLTHILYTYPGYICCIHNIHRHTDHTHLSYLKHFPVHATCSASCRVHGCPTSVSSAMRFERGESEKGR